MYIFKYICIYIYIYLKYSIHIYTYAFFLSGTIYGQVFCLHASLRCFRQQVQDIDAHQLFRIIVKRLRFAPADLGPMIDVWLNVTSLLFHDMQNAE